MSSPSESALPRTPSGSGREAAHTAATSAASARHPQELEVRSEKAVLVNPAIEATAAEYARRVAAGELTREEGAQLSVWEAALAEARACLAKLLAELETYDSNRQAALTAALAWAVLRAKLPEETVLETGLVFAGGEAAAAEAPLPHLWAVSCQPARLLPLLARVWGEGHPRAAPRLLTDLGGHAVSHLVDAVVLGQRLKAGRGSRPVPYLAPGREAWRVAPERAARLLASLPAQRLLAENLAYVARCPRDFLTWGVPAEARAFLYPIVMNAVLKDDPTQIEYVRLDEEQVRRVAEAQRGAGSGSAPAAAKGEASGARAP